jgi:predicted PurR-regulated permease PerM
MSWWKIGLWVAVVAAVAFFLFAVRSIILPFALAFVISVLLDPTIRKLRMRGLSRGASVAIVFVVFFGALTTLAIYVTPVISSQLTNFSQTLDYYSKELARENPNDSVYLRWNPAERAERRGATGQVDDLISRAAPTLRSLGLPTTRRAIVERYVDPYRSDVLRIVENFFKGFLGLVTSAASQVLFLLLTPLIVYMILIDLEQLKLRSATWIPPSIRAQTLALVGDIGQVFIKYLRGVVIVVAIYTAWAAALLLILEVPYSILLALLFGALYMIPYVGAFISYASLILVTGFSGVSGNWFMSFDSPWIFALVCAAIYTPLVEAYDKFVYPRIVGGSVGLHPVVSMFVIFAGGALFGLVGMILAFPLAGSVKVILERLLRVTSSQHQEGLGLPSTPLRHRSALEV